MAIPIGMLMLTRGIYVSEWILVAGGSAILLWATVTSYLQRRNPVPDTGREAGG